MQDKEDSSDSSPKLVLPNEFKSRLASRRGTGALMVDVSANKRKSKVGTARSPPASPKIIKKIRMMDEKEKIFDLYTWSKVLQEEGDGGKVVVCEPKSTNTNLAQKAYVMKMRSKKSLDHSAMQEQFRKSLENLLNLPEHVGVLPVKEALEDDHFYYIVMEQATGGSFFGGLLSEFEDGIMPPTEVCRLVRSILEAVGHVHQQGMLHRDIKPDNLVMRLCDDVQSPTGSSRRIAIIDFDHADSEYQDSLKESQEFCGTVFFSAPETFKGYFSIASDLYSIGIIMYLLMTGKMPFAKEIFEEEMAGLELSPKRRGWQQKVAKRLSATEIDWKCDPWPKEPLSCDLCKWLLELVPANRPKSAEDALAHGWFEPLSPSLPALFQK